MTLEFNQIAPQIKDMGETLANRNKNDDTLLEKARALLREHATNFDDLHTRITQAEEAQKGVRFNWVGAAPTDEALTASFPPPSAPTRATVIASDGSQIYLDKHGIALYYLVNVGAIVYRHGSGETPDVRTEPQLFFKDDDIFGNQGLLVSNNLVNAKRDVAEVDILARLSFAYTQDDTRIALIDGQLTMHALELSAKEQKQFQKEYLSSLDTLQNNGMSIAAYIDRPRGSFVLALLHLADLGSDAITEESIRRNPFVTLTDAQLFAELPAGHRSALFNQRSKANADYSQAGHQVYFFYLNTATNENPNIVRVELPVWVAKNPDALNALHAVLLQQSKITGGYPYVLARAHELAIIPPSEREALETMLAINLRKAGVSVAASLKQQNKNALFG